jgi:hypothetical protein
VFSLDELGKPIPAGHIIGAQGRYFPSTEGAAEGTADVE